MTRYLICQALHRPFDMDNSWLAFADGMLDAFMLCLMVF